MRETIIRSVSGIVFIALVLLSLTIHPLTYLALFSIILVLSWIELSRMFQQKILPGLKIPVAILLVVNFTIIYFMATGQFSNTWMLFPAITPVLFLAIHWTIQKSGSDSDLPFALGSMIYLLAGFTLLHVLAFSTGGDEGYTPRWILFTLYFLWMNDTMAYVSGRLLGKNRIWPSVSPAKTWEGSIGGAVFTIILALVFSRIYPELTAVEWTGYALTVVVFGTLGDFLESWLKRKAGVKDSGRLIPGHGGILDRFDSFILAIPFVTIYLTLVL